MGRKKHYYAGEYIPPNIINFIACGKPTDIKKGSLIRSKDTRGFVNVVLEVSKVQRDTMWGVCYVLVRSVRFARVNIDGTHELLNGRRSRSIRINLANLDSSSSPIFNRWERVEARRTRAQHISYVRIRTLNDLALTNEIRAHVASLEGVNTQYVPPELRTDNNGDE